MRGGRGRGRGRGSMRRLTGEAWGREAGKTMDGRGEGRFHSAQQRKCRGHISNLESGVALGCRSWMLFFFVAVLFFLPQRVMMMVSWTVDSMHAAVSTVSRLTVHGSQVPFYPCLAERSPCLAPIPSSSTFNHGGSYSAWHAIHRVHWRTDTSLGHILDACNSL
jgi:hypothetical protein